MAKRDVALGVGGAALAGHGGEADEQVRLFPHGREDLALVKRLMSWVTVKVPKARSPWRACGARGSPRGRSGRAFPGTRRPGAAPGPRGPAVMCSGCQRPARRCAWSVFVSFSYFPPFLNKDPVLFPLTGKRFDEVLGVLQPGAVSLMKALMAAFLSPCSRAP